VPYTTSAHVFTTHYIGSRKKYRQQNITSKISPALYRME
jgi:hypothetical protein